MIAKTIHIKLVRELWQMRWQNLAIASVLAAGISMVIMSVSTLQSLQRSRALFYQHSRFGHVFMHLKRAPMGLVSRLRTLPGVQAVEARVVMQVTLSVSDMSEPVTGRIVSLPAHRAPEVNRLYLRSGRMLDPNRTGEVLVSEAFATAHRFQSGDVLTAIINGKRQSLRIVGIVLSPEYVYSVRPGELLPDDRRYGILWMDYEELAAACNLKNAFNDISLLLADPTGEAPIVRQLDDLMAPYGGTNAYGRQLHPSHRFLDNELIQLRTMALVPPVIFLAVTMFLLQIVMSRQIAIQREQIAMMRAFGYTQGEIAAHFAAFALLIGSLGVSIGMVVGAKLGADLTLLYTQFFRFPVMAYELDWRVLLVTAGIALLAVLAGVGSAVRRAAILPPAQAMQPEAPPRYHASLIERMGMQNILPQTSRMVLRHLERWPLRSTLSVVGIASSIAILVLGNFIQDTVDHVMDFQFYAAGRQGLMVTFVEPTSSQSLYELKKFPGVMTIEPFRATPVRLVHRQHHRRVELLGLPSKPSLFRVVDSIRGPLELPERGLLMSRRLAQILQCELGDVVEVNVLEGARTVDHVTVTAIIDDYLDLNAYMEIASLRRLLREQDAVSGASLSIDSRDEEKLYHLLRQTPRVAGVSIKKANIQSYQNTMAENLLRMKMLNVLFATIVAVGVVYNCARISLSERSRELATLRVLGFTRGETSFILLGELAVLVLAATPVGMMMGYGLAWLLILALDTELHRFPLVIQARTYGFAVTVVISAAFVSALIVRRRMDKFNLVAVLKARD